VSFDSVVAALEERLPHAVTRHASVAELTTYRVGGPVAALVRVANEDELRGIAAVLANDPVPVLVIGRGSNLLVADGGFEGLGMLLEGNFERIEIDSACSTVRAGSAVALPVLARRSAAAGIGGLEFFVGIPGSVGGAVRMNAGGHGRETAEVLQCAGVLELLDGESAAVEARPMAALDFGYRHSNITSTSVVAFAELAGTREDPDVCERRIDEIVRWRREHQPGGSNAGSVFRNPPGDSAGRLIDAVGLKGLRVGGAVVSPKHANFFQAEQGATADDVARLVDTVRARVADATGVDLVPELQMVGFRDLGSPPQAPAPPGVRRRSHTDPGSRKTEVQ
jgi:UDP-N-acetylmuramate dehydrogenase